MSEIKQFVFVNKNTGDLMTAVRINFLDKKDFDREILNVKETNLPYRIGMLVHDGWVLTGPQAFSRCFLNAEAEQWFEILGEL